MRPSAGDVAPVSLANGAGSMLGCSGIEQKVKCYLKTRVACVQRGSRVQIARRNVIQHDNVCGDFQMTERRFDRDGRLDQLHARLNALDQGCDVQHDGTNAVVSIAGSGRNAAAFGILHESLLDWVLKSPALLVRYVLVPYKYE